MEENNVVEVAVEEAVKHIDGESFAIGMVIGTAVTGGVWLVVKKVVVPGVKKIKIRIENKRQAKIAELESDGFTEE